MGSPLSGAEVTPSWSFLSNHGKALLCVAADPAVRIRDVAAALDITERAAQRIVRDLVTAGYVEAERTGRRNAYAVRTDLPLTLPVARQVPVGRLLDVLVHTTD